MCYRVPSFFVDNIVTKVFSCGMELLRSLTYFFEIFIRKPGTGNKAQNRN